MAKLTGPLLSLGARGSIAKTLVASKWRGVPYMRQHVVPADPNTLAQQVVRQTFSHLREMWKLAPSSVIATWDSFAQGRPFTGMNKFVGENVRVLNGEADMDNFIGSPGSKGGLPPTAFLPVAGAVSGTIDWTMTAPAPPPGWVLTSAIVTAFPDSIPTSIFAGPYLESIDLVAPLAGTLAGLPPGAVCQCSGWLTWTKPDLKIAYSVGLTVQAPALP